MISEGKPLGSPSALRMIVYLKVFALPTNSPGSAPELQSQARLLRHWRVMISFLNAFLKKTKGDAAGGGVINLVGGTVLNSFFSAQYISRDRDR